MRAYLQSLFTKAFDENKRNILNLAGTRSDARFLDLGCDDGEWTTKVADTIGTQKRFGLEIVSERAELARKRGIVVTEGDLMARLPFDEGSFDIVHANQVIEHVSDVDHFASEIFRILSPGGYAVISTENASSWHNVAATALGYQMFSLTNFSKVKSGLGNPFALHRGETHEFSSWTHKTIFSYQGLLDLFSVHGFDRCEIAGAGYYPLPATVGRLDPRHAHFITLRAYRPAA